MRAKQPAQLLRIQEAADLMAIGRTTVYDLIANGSLSPVHLGAGGTRVRADEVARLIEAKTDRRMRQSLRTA